MWTAIPPEGVVLTFDRDVQVASADPTPFSVDSGTVSGIGDLGGPNVLVIVSGGPATEVSYTAAPATLFGLDNELPVLPFADFPVA